MRNLFFLLIVFCFAGASAQNIQVLSGKDSLRVSFASLLINGDKINYSKTANDDGLLIVSHLFEDSVMYRITIQCFGFEKFSKKMLGSDLKKLQKIYLSPSNINLDEVVVTAQYEPTTAEKSVQKIRVIDKEKIQQMAAVNLRDVLSNQLNVRLQQDNILGSSMSLQGLSGQNVKILIDGVPMIGRMDGSIDLSHINMNNVERIEFIEGPLSVQYGTNALAGTINIITKKTLTKKISAGATSYYESIGTYNFTGDLSYSYKKHNLQLSGGRNYFDGWSPSKKPFELPKSKLADSSRALPWDAKEQYFATLAYQYSFKKVDLGFKSSYFDEVITNRNTPIGFYKEEAFDDYYYTKRFDNSLSVNARLSKNWSLNSLTSYNYYQRIKTTLFKNLTTLHESPSPNSSDHDTSRYTLSMARGSFIYARPLAKLNYELGYDLNYESGFGKRIKGGAKYMGDYAAFATMEYKLSTLVIKPGFRYAYNTMYQTPLIPSLNVKWSVSEHHVLRGSYARGFRAPTLKEMQFDFNDANHMIVGSESLKAEESDNYSLSYNYNRDIRKCKVKFDGNLFYNSIFNLISLQQQGTSAQYTYFNVDRFKSMGLQLGTSLNFKRLYLQGGFNYTGRYNYLSGAENVPDFSYSPEVLANASYKWLKQKAVISLFYKYNGKVPSFISTDGVVIAGMTQAYHIMDLTLSKFFWNDRVSVALGCKNIFDVRNIRSGSGGGGAHSASSATIPLSTGRNYFIKLTLNLSKS